jgi:hypothetical protein
MAAWDLRAPEIQHLAATRLGQGEKPLKVTSKNLLRGPIAALRGARSLAYLLDMSRSLRSVRLALVPLATVFRGALKKLAPEPIKSR